MREKKRILNIICVILLIMLSASFFVACNRNTLGNDTIDIYADENSIVSTGYDVALNDLISEVARNIISYSVPISVANEINDIAVEADRLIRSYNIGESQYCSLKEDLSINKYKYSSTIYNIYKDIEDSNTISNIKSFISTNIRMLGKDNFSNYIYDLIIYRLNYIYNKYKQSYEESNIKEKEMNEAKENLDTFKEKVSKTDFNIALNTTLIIWDILSTDLEGFVFSNSEIATLIQIPSFSNTIDGESWTLILKLFGNTAFSNETYVGDIFDKLVSNDELKLIGEKIPYVFEFISSIQSKIDKETISSLSGDIVDIIYSLIPKFDENDWQLLNNIFDIDFDIEDNDTYRQVGYKYYRSDFNTYYLKMKDNSCTVDDLKTATRENVDEIFEGIIANIHPAFSYRWFNND